MRKARSAALSAAGLMLIAGCSGGGRSGGNALPGPVASAQATGLANAVKVTLSLTVPAKQALSFRRGSASVRPAGTSRRPTYVSPSTYYVALDAVYGSTNLYSTYFTLAQCSPSSGPYGVAYACPAYLPSGTFTLYSNLYDAQGYLLSTNLYSNPSPVTVYPNGSPYSNNLYVQTAGVLSSVQIETPGGCFAAGTQQSIPLLFLDADGNTIVGPLANPFTGDVTAYNGAGLGAISAYVIYAGAPLVADSLTIYDTSIYASPYIFVSGQEGAVNIAASVANIPVYSNNAVTYSLTAGTAATGTYIAWALENPPMYGIYALAIEQTLNQVVPCGGVPNGLYDDFVYVGSILSPTTPYVVANDAGNNFVAFDASWTANYTYAYEFFQTASPYNSAGPHFQPYQTLQFSPSGPIVDFFTSANVTGRINIIYQGASTGVIETIDTSNGAITSNNPFDATAGIVFSGSTRITGSPTTDSLYYDVPGTPWLYGVNASSSPGSAFPAIDFSVSTVLNGQIYALSPSGAGTPATEVVRGADTLGSFHVCAFDANNFAGGIFCANTNSQDANIASMQYDPGTGDLIWASGSTSVFAVPLHGVTPSAFTSSVFRGHGAQPLTAIPTTFPFTSSVYTLSHNADRVLPGLEAVPGVAGLYDGPQASGPCSGTGEITWLRYNAGSWVYLAHTCWPTHYVTLTYP